MSSTKMQAVAKGLSCLAIALSASRSAMATDVFNLEGYGPISRAMGGTGVAYDIGAAGMMYNPATLGLMNEGSEFHLGLDVITTDIEAKDKATGETASSSDHGNNRGPYYAPELAFSHRAGRFAFGVGAFAEGGLGTEYGANSFLSRTVTNGLDTGLDNSSRLLVLRIPFAAAFKVNDRLTVGGSVDAVYTALNLGLLLDVTQIGALAVQNRLSGSLVPALAGIPGLSGAHIGFSKNTIVGGGADAWGIGGKLGFTYQLSPDTRIGAAYVFKTHMGDLKGNATLTAISSTLGNIPLGGQIRIRNFQMPAQASVGISHRFNDQLTVALDYQRVFWKDAMKNLDVGFVAAGTGATVNVLLPQNYRDINVFSIGAEYRYSDRWTFRAGASYADNAIADNLLLAIAPAQLTTHVTGGFSYAFNRNNRLDFALSVGLRKSLSNASLPNTAAPIEVRHSQVNAALAYVHRF